MSNDTLVLRDCPCHLYNKANKDTVEVDYDMKKLIGNVYNYNLSGEVEVYEAGQEHNVVGFLSIPTKYLLSLNKFNCKLNLSEIINKSTVPLQDIYKNQNTLDTEINPALDFAISLVDADKNNDNQITRGEIHDYLYDHVEDNARLLNREQSPQIDTNDKTIILARIQ